MGLYYEDFKVGDVYTSPGRTITEADVVNFAGLSGDFNLIHTDEEYAKNNSPFETRIAHGLLGLSITSGLMTRLGIFEGTVIAFLGLDWNFRAPIYLNDTVHFRMTIEKMRKTSKEDRGIIVRKVELLNQRDEVVQEGTMTIMIKRKATEGEVV